MAEQRKFRFTTSTVALKEAIRAAVLPFVNVVDESSRTLTVSPIFERDMDMLADVAVQHGDDVAVFGREVI